MATVTPTSITKFLGLNMNNSSDTQLIPGESPRMKNFRITNDYKLKKTNGYKKICDIAENEIIRHIGKYTIAGNDYLIVVANGNIYTVSGDTATSIGTLTDDVTSVFEFNDKLYFINGHEYKKWNGTTLDTVDGYIPLVKIGTTPLGAGTDYEGVNMLTGKKHMTFSADGSSKDFYLAEVNVDSIDSVYVNGTETYPTKDTVNGKVSFNNAPATGTDNVDIYWTKDNNTRSAITGNKYICMYGVANDTRVLMYGNSGAKNRIVFSDFGNIGTPNVEYFPAMNFWDIGSTDEPITDINRQYDRLVISTINQTYYAVYETSEVDGNVVVQFPTYPLNSSHGMVAYGQGQLLDNYVTTIDSSIAMWTNTQVKDERNVQIISDKIQTWLNEKDLSKAITMDYQNIKEYWLAIDKEIMIYNYQTATFYLLELPKKVTYLYCEGNDIYMGLEDGAIYEWDDKATTYDGEIIDAIWESGYYDFEAEYLRKTMRIVWLGLKPFSRTSLDISYISDRDSATQVEHIEAQTTDFASIDFKDFTFNTQRIIKPFRIKLKAKKFTFLKIIIANNNRQDRLLINTMTIKKIYGGESK